MTEFIEPNSYSIVRSLDRSGRLPATRKPKKQSRFVVVDAFGLPLSLSWRHPSTWLRARRVILRGSVDYQRVRDLNTVVQANFGGPDPLEIQPRRLPWWWRHFVFIRREGGPAYYRDLRGHRVLLCLFRREVRVMTPARWARRQLAWRERVRSESQA